MAYSAHSIALAADLFDLALHPSRPLLAAGLSSGHVYTYAWPSAGSDTDSNSEAGDAGPPSTDYSTVWKTRRHKGSCRCVSYSHDGEVLYSAGTDSLLKAASAERGQVTSKALLPGTDPATSLLPLSPAHLLLGTDAGSIHLLDTREAVTTVSARPSASWARVHEDYISSLTPLPATAASTTGFSRQFVATGDTTLSFLDVRKPGAAVSRSENQEDEFLSGCFVANAPSRSKDTTQKVLTGTAGGVVTVWNRGFWEDHQDRIPVSRGTGDSVDALLALPEEFEVARPEGGGGGGWGRYFAAGSGDGKVRIVKMGSNNVVATMAHSLSKDEAKAVAGGKARSGDYEAGLEEGVVALGLDCDGRIVSGGGEVVKIWMPKQESEEEDDEDRGVKRSGSGSGSDSESGDESDSDSDSGKKDKKKRKKKKRKGGKGKAKSVGVKNVTSFTGLD